MHLLMLGKKVWNRVPERLAILLYRRFNQHGMLLSLATCAPVKSFDAFNYMRLDVVVTTGHGNPFRLISTLQWEPVIRCQLCLTCINIISFAKRWEGIFPYRKHFNSVRHMRWIRKYNECCMILRYTTLHYCSQAYMNSSVIYWIVAVLYNNERFVKLLLVTHIISYLWYRFASITSTPNWHFRAGTCFSWQFLLHP